MRPLFIRTLLLLGLPACSGGPSSIAPFPALQDLPAATTQVLLCTTATWIETAAVLQCLTRSTSGWQKVGAPIAARVGGSGLGWGVGLHVDGDGPKKREGDGRAPAGVFTLGTAFGYAPSAPAGMQVPYRHATERDYFVDAPDSAAYNKWRHIPEGQANDPKQRWQSSERMRRLDALYELGMVVNHNMTPAMPGRGSAIFLHVWRGADKPTSGCTSMAREDLLRVLTWLRADAQPLLVQVPQSQLSQLRF